MVCCAELEKTKPVKRSITVVYFIFCVYFFGY
jgi:hypothetical protein